METYSYNEYSRFAVKDSVLIPGKKWTDRENGITMCPRCSTVNPFIIKHGTTEECIKCGLIMTVFGNALQISDPSE